MQFVSKDGGRKRERKRLNPEERGWIRKK